MMKMRKMAACMAAVILAMAIAGTTASAYVDSAKDQYFVNFDIEADVYKAVSNPIEKENSTSVYCYITKADATVLAQTWGCTVSAFKENLTLNAKGVSTTAVKLSVETEYQIYNKIYETGYRYAGLKLKTTSSVYDTVTGCWSADSVNTSGMAVATD